MAFSNKSGTKKQIIKVKIFSVSQAQVVGTGAFGAVFKGFDAKKNTIAAKRIDEYAHPRILTQDLDKLMQLDHPKVMKILDVQKTESIVWMIMPLCELGDLNHFYRTNDVLPEKKIDGMKQIAAGIKYLDSEDIAHRDIKPGNIMVASSAPLTLHLTDFDVCKCLDPEVVTSLMSSNFGTLAFKAPEFFQRTSEKKGYHKNVDIYAAGLTFLAMLQADTKQKMLIPHIETPMEDSELHAPSIGLLISERIKYKVSELSIVKIEEQRSLKWLIKQMTSIEPEKCLSAQDVLGNLEQFKPQCDADTNDDQVMSAAIHMTK